MSAGRAGVPAEFPGQWGPCTATEATRYAAALRQLLSALDREIVTAALVGEREAELLGAERHEVYRVREFLDRRIGVSTELGGLRGSALAVLNGFAHELKTAGQVHGTAPSAGRGDHSVGAAPAAGAGTAEGRLA